MLPEFASMQTIKAVQSIAGNPVGFSTWFEALDWMKSEIDKKDFDIALLGCGAYGVPLAAHIKQNGKKPFMWEEYCNYCLESRVYGSKTARCRHLYK